MVNNMMKSVEKRFIAAVGSKIVSPRVVSKREAYMESIEASRLETEKSLENYCKAKNILNAN